MPSRWHSNVGYHTWTSHLLSYYPWPLIPFHNYRSSVASQDMFLLQFNSGHFYSAPQCSHCKRCTSYGNSVRPSATRRYCVKTTARSTVQFALSDSKMCLVLQKPKIIPRDDPFPWNLGSNWPTPPDSSESWRVSPCSASTARASGKSSIMMNRKSYTGFPTSHQPRFYAAPNFLKMGIKYLNLLSFIQFRH